MRRYRDRACGTGSLLQCDAVRSAQIAWCQANRLRVVEEKSKGVTVVHLDRARTPAPSWSALGWLETSIRAYAKFVDVAAKVTATQPSRIWFVENAWRSMKFEHCLPRCKPKRPDVADRNDTESLGNRSRPPPTAATIAVIPISSAIMFAIASSGLCGASYILGPVVPAVSAVCRLLPLLVDAKVHSGIESCLCAGVYFGDTTICWRFLASANCKNASVIAADDLQTLVRPCHGTGDSQRLIPEWKTYVVDGNDTVSLAN